MVGIYNLTRGNLQFSVANVRVGQLSDGFIKDNTIFPGEWYGGVLVFDPPQGDQGDQKSYRIIIPIGPDIHQIDITQERVQS